MAREIGMGRDTWYRRMRDNGWKVSDLRLVATALRVPLSALTGEDD